MRLKPIKEVSANAPSLEDLAPTVFVSHCHAACTKVGVRFGCPISIFDAPTRFKKFDKAAGAPQLSLCSGHFAQANHWRALLSIGPLVSCART
jgi:hypothetical protein